MEVSCFPVFDKDGKVVRAIEYYVDITARKEIEDSLKTSINEKEALLKEVHHRVKNNLQIISSLLNLQARQITDKHYHDIFKENQNRIKSMVLVHEKLYQSKNLASIDPDNYIKSLVTYLFHAYGVSTENVALITDIKTEKINADTAIPYGIIINELVSNCLKHAFPPPQGGKPEIKIRIFTDKTNTTHLTVKDNGKGIPEQTDLENAGTLGLQLVNALVQQLGGTMKCSRNNGTTFDISIDQQLMNEENEK
jgi:two-component sensor histidine kinase